MKSRFSRLLLALLGIAACLALSIALERWFGIAIDTSARVVSAGACLVFIGWVARQYPGKRWPWIALAIAALVDIGLFFTPLVDRPLSRGELMLFAVPDAFIFLSAMLAARVAAGPPEDDQERAVRQQIIFGIVLGLAFCAVLFALVLAQAPAIR